MERERTGEERQRQRVGTTGRAMTFASRASMFGARAVVWARRRPRQILSPITYLLSVTYLYPAKLSVSCSSFASLLWFLLVYLTQSHRVRLPSSSVPPSP
eukprot:6200383-Pleurochrysis_carterae.AAC.3